MEDNRSSRALARIEHALERIEAAARQPEASLTPPNDAAIELLQARHDRLRTAVQDSLRQLDQLIEGTQG